MFKKILEAIKSYIRDEIGSLKCCLDEKFSSAILDNKNKIADFDLRFQQLEIKLDKKLIAQHQEYSDKLFEILASFLRWNKEISLVSYLGGKEPDLKKLKLELMRPMMEENWAKTNSSEAEKINKALESKGERVRQAWAKYKDEKMALERAKQDTKLVDAKLEVLEILMEGMK